MPTNNTGQIPWWDIRNKSNKAWDKVNNKRKTKLTDSESWSSYWMDEDSYDYFYDNSKGNTKIKIDGFGKGKRAASIDLGKASRLAAVRRAVSNFVRILTNDDEIRVVFNSGNDSYTDGKHVIISAESDPKKFDILVGTALHEAAHCLLSEGVLKLLKDDEFTDRVLKRFGDLPNWLDGNRSTEDYQHIADVKNIINCLEDRRIDAEVYRRAPGYRPYYQAMYDNYWNARDIAKALIRTEKLRVPTVDSYMFRIINITNPATKYTIDRLPAFRKIYDVFGLNNILRFSDSAGNVKTTEMFDTALEIYQIILDNRIDEDDEPSAEGEDQSSPMMMDGPISDSDDMDVDDSTQSSAQTGTNDHDVNNHDLSQSQPSQQISDKDIEKAVAKELGKNNLGKADPKMEKVEQKMWDLLNGDVKKKKIGKKMKEAVTTMEEGDITVSSIMVEQERYPYVRIPKLTNSAKLLLPRAMFYSGYSSYSENQVNQIRAGRRLGQIIVDRIKIRHDHNDTKFSRRPVGKIDRRLIHSLGVDNENIFFNKIIQEYKKSVIYLTIDCSSSMYGEKWDRTLMLTTGLAYAATKINNFDVVVNLRYGLDCIWSINMFDSRQEPFSHFERWMTKFIPAATTPESIVYDIEKNFIEDLKTRDNNVYFITITDGGPNYSPVGQRLSYYNSGFGSDVAALHCSKLLKRFREIDIRVLSYYVASNRRWGTNDWEQTHFKKAYGKDGLMIPLDNFSMISKSVNDLLTRSTQR